MSETWSGLALVVGYIVAGLILVLGALVVWKLFTGKLDLTSLIVDADGKASLSRFQFLIFTFVIAGLYLLLSIDSGSLIDVPQNALLLMGVSGGSYVVSKGIDAARHKEDLQAGAAPPQPPPARRPPAPPPAL